MFVNFNKVEPVTKKSQKFQCKNCNMIFVCIKYDRIAGSLVNICDYNYCPYCGIELFTVRGDIDGKT